MQSESEKRMKKKKKDIMDSILEGRHTVVESRIEQLNCLIYKNDMSADTDDTDDRTKKIWQTEKDNVSVQVWEDKAKIKVKVSQGKPRKISLKRIANIAMDAILEELKKED